jgi:CRP-like cAMP-binding protein
MLEIASNSNHSSSHQPGSVAALSIIEAQARPSLLKRDAALFWEGDTVEGYYRVVSGAVRLCKLMPDGRRQVADFFAAGDLILVEFADVHHFTAEAIVDSVICYYPRSAIDLLAQTDHRFARQLLSLACERLMSAHSQMLVLGRKTAEERLATFLVTQAKRHSTPNRLMSVPMSRADIADYLGLTVETVSRVLSKFKREGIIDLPDIHSVRVKDCDRLALVSEGEG